MEATAAASAPPCQPAALSAQTPPKQNLTATRAPSNTPTATPPAPQTTTMYTTHDSQQIAVAAAQQLPSPASWHRARAGASPAARQTLPAVQDFLQKAYDTVQRSQLGAAPAPDTARAPQHSTAAAARTPDNARVKPSPKIAAVVPKNTAISQPSTPATRAMTYQSPRIMPSTVQPSLANSAALVRDIQSRYQPAHTRPKPDQSVALPTPDNMRQPYYASQARYTPNMPALINPTTVTNNVRYSYYANRAHTPTTTQIGRASTVQSRGAANVGYSGYVYYNTNWQTQSNRSQGQDSEKRSLLVAKRRSPTVPKTSESSDTGKSENTQESEKSDTKKTSSAESPQISAAPNVPKEAESAQAPQTKSSRSSEPQKPAQSPKKTPTPYSSSRVAQTYLASKALQKDRQNGLLSPAQALKNNTTQNTQANASGPSRLNGPNGRYGPNGTRPQGAMKAPEPDPKKRVLVSGFPAYTQSQDLVRVLKTFGSCMVERCRNRLAVVSFETETAVKNALKASEEICIYGEFIEISPYTNARHVEDLYRAYKKVISTQKGQDIIQPSNIDLTGDFYQQLENIQSAIRLTREQVQAVTNLYVDLELVLQQEWPGCVAIPFGSIPTGLGIASSDADCFVELPAAERRRGAAGGAAAFVLRARRLLASYPRVFAQLVAIPRANTPIVKFRHVPSGFHCDVSSKTPLGAQNSKLVKLLLEADARVPPVAVLVKYWAKVHELSGTGRLTNYALTMMVVFYLQQPHVALAPPVETLQRDPERELLVDHWNAGFAPPEGPPPEARTQASVPDLLGGFFQFYAGFDLERLAVCPFLGAAVPKAHFDEPERLPPQFARYVANVRDNLASPIRHNTPFCVQDPFEQSHNVASSVCAKLAADIRAYIRFAADTFAADRASGCAAFLRTVLLQRPKLRRDRTTPTTKVFLIPRIRADIADEDWRGRVREVVLDTIFEQILKIKLERDREREEREAAEEEKREADREEKERRRAEKRGKVAKEERPESDPAARRIAKEKYAGSTAKPVWRRRKNYSMGALEATADLVQRQRRATDQILHSADDCPLQFHLELGFREAPRHCYVYARLVDGDLEAFRGFVGFLHSVMFDWFRILMRPHLAPHAAADADADADDASVCTIRFEPDDDDISRNMRTVSLTDAEDPAMDTDDPASDAAGPAAAAMDTCPTDGSKIDPTDIH